MRIAKGWPTILLVFMLLGACAGGGSDSLSGNGISAASKEVVVRLCADTSMRQAELMLARHSLWISKRLSVNLLTLEWSDERSVSDVLNELDGLSGICMAQPNYGYDIAPADSGAPK